MSWLTGWNRRKQITVNGSIAGAQPDYQMKLTVNQGIGTDTPGIIYCGGNIKNDFSDLRFTDSGGSTELYYWIESITGTSGAKSAIVWVKIGSIPTIGTTIYVYYNKSISTTTSSDTNTFIRIISGVNGAWTLDGNALDTSGNNLNGTVNGGMGYTTGKFGQAGSFNGSSTSISLPATGISNENVPFTISAWVKASSFAGYPYIFSSGSNVPAFVGKFNIGLRFNTDGTIFFLTGKSQTWDMGKLTTNIFSTGVWYHVVATCDGSKTLAGFNIYVNGILTTMTSYGSGGAASTAYDAWYIGRENGGAYFNGIIDEARIYNRALTQAEVTDLQNNYGYTTTNYVGKELVRKYASPEPIFGTTGAEEVQPGSLRITSTPSGAGIWIALNGQTPLWTNVYTPDPVTGLPPGYYDIRLTRNDYTDWTFGNAQIISNTETQISATMSTVANITADSMTISTDDSPCRYNICNVTVNAKWKNTGGTSGDFVPSLSIDNGAVPFSTPYGSRSLGANITTEWIQFIISGLPAGTHSICPNPN